MNSRPKPRDDSSEPAAESIEKLTHNLQRIAALWPEVMEALSGFYEQHRPLENRLTSHIASAFTGYLNHFASKPENLMHYPMDWMERSLALWDKQWRAFIDQPEETSGDVRATDRRFKNKPWQDNWYFDTLHQQYLMTSRWLDSALAQTTAGMDAHDAHLVTFYTRQWVDALAPGNYLLTNPEAMQATLESSGDSLVRGMQNFLRDVREGRMRMVPDGAFEFGRNIATTPGKVVFQNELMQLLQFTPQTETVFQTPLLLIPAWINKYYILDLQQENSLVRWLVGQGHTVFVISWVNPDGRHADFGFDDYLTLGPLAAMEAIGKATGETAVNIIGYCLGGTLLTCLLSWLASRGEAARVKSATLLTTLVDFSEAGDLEVFIDEPQLQALEEKMNAHGYLDGRDMAMTFNMLRPADLIWSFFITNYLLGKDPFPFDLLFWNADVTRMPAKMHSFYLRQMYQHNRLAEPSALTIAGEAIDVTQIATPLYFLATREDHIAPWESAYRTTQLVRGPTRFVLAASGHIAGVVNPPGRQKYGHWVGCDTPPAPAEWLENARFEECSWWPDWQQWVADYAGGRVPARQPGDGALRVLEDAPGSYVTVKSKAAS